MIAQCNESKITTAHGGVNQRASPLKNLNENQFQLRREEGFTTKDKKRQKTQREKEERPFVSFVVL
jgi:hypothetical protein